MIPGLSKSKAWVGWTAWIGWTAWKVWDNNGWVLDSILWLGSLFDQWLEDEENAEKRKENFLSWWAIDPILWIGSGNRVWTFWNIYNDSAFLNTLKEMWLSWDVKKDDWFANRIADLYFGAVNAEKNRKAAENEQINAQLSWDVRKTPIENLLWTGDVSWLTTEETFLDKRLIDKENWEDDGDSRLWSLWYFVNPILTTALWANKKAQEGADWIKHESDYWMPTFDSAVHWMNNPLWLLSTAFDNETDKYSFNWMVATLAEAKNALSRWEITQADYDKIYNAAVTDITPYYNKKFWVNDNMRRAWWLTHYLDNAIDWQIKNADIEDRLDDAYPERVFEREWDQVRIADAQKKFMSAFVESLNKTKDSTYDKQLYDRVYAVWTNNVQRWNNSMNYAGTIARSIIARYWWDLNKISWKDKEIYQDILREYEVYDKFVDNFTKLLAKIPQFKDPVTWKVNMPDVIDWKTPREWMFDWVEEMLYKDSDWAHTSFDHKHISPIDVLENMTQSISYDYIMAHPWENWYKIPWEIWQYWIWTVYWWDASEIAQELLWMPQTVVYNWVSNKQSDLSRAWQDQDMTDMVTVNSHFWPWNIQRWVAWTMEYLPEIEWAVAEWIWWNWIWDTVRATKTMRVLRSQWLRRTISQAMRYAWWNKSTKLPSVWERYKNVLKNIPKVVDDIIKEWWVKVIKWWKVVTESLDDVKATQRLINNLLYDLWTIEVPMDLYFDARYADADLEQGSDVSFIWSLWWHLLWTYLPWLYRTWLFKDAKLIYRAFRWTDVWDALKQWWEWWWAFNLMKLTENSKYNPLDAMAKAEFWLNNSRLASFQELQQMNWIMNDIVDSFTEVYKSLKPWLKNITDESVKHMIWQYLSQIFWADSQMSRRIWQLVADKRANPADIYKYVLWLRWTANIWPWRSAIAIADNTAGKFVNFYDEALDTMPIFREWWFSRALREWFTRRELKYLKEHWKEWAVLDNFKKNKDWRYIFTTEWLEKASKDIDAMEMDIPFVSKITEDAESFDKLMKNSNMKNISNETLEAIKQSWAYDTLANALWSISWLCNLDWV